MILALLDGIVITSFLCHRFQPAPMQVLLSEEITGSLRKIKVHYNLCSSGLPIYKQNCNFKLRNPNLFFAQGVFDPSEGSVQESGEKRTDCSNRQDQKVS